MAEEFLFFELCILTILIIQLYSYLYIFTNSPSPVSYTHLDVYKRQVNHFYFLRGANLAGLAVVYVHLDIPGYRLREMCIRDSIWSLLTIT